MRSIAREVGVSPTLVSQLFRGDPKLRISDARKKEIFAARDRLGGVKVRPSKLSHVIVAPEGTQRTQEYTDRNTRNNPLYRSFERAMAQRGYRIQYEYIPEAVVCDRIQQWLRRSRHPDGLLILWNYCTPQLAELLRTYNFPHITNDVTRDHLGINTICDYSADGIRQLVEHLASLGHRRMAFFGYREFYRYPMMVSAMARLDLPIDTSIHCWLKRIDYPENLNEVRRYAFEAFDDWYARHGDITAIACSNDDCALGVIDAMQRRGLVPGRDLSVVGYDNIEHRTLSQGQKPILTTVDYPFERIGRRMAELLINQIEHGQNQIVHERLPVKLVVRQTTGPAPEGSH